MGEALLSPGHPHRCDTESTPGKLLLEDNVQKLKDALTPWLSRTVHCDFNGSLVRGHLRRVGEHGDGQSETLSCRGEGTKERTVMQRGRISSDQLLTVAKI